MIEQLQKNPSLNKEKLNAIKRIIYKFKEQGGFPEEYKIYATLLGAEIISTLLRGTQVSLIVLKKENEFIGGFTSFDSKSNFDHLLSIYPNIQIPIKRIIEEFFEESNNEQIIETLGLISVNEKKVIDVLKSKDFKEIIIKKNNGMHDISIEVIKETDILNEDKIKEIKRILGLNEYSEITLKMRNSKHLYLKNKFKIISDPIDSAQK